MIMIMFFVFSLLFMLMPFLFMTSLNNKYYMLMTRDMILNMMLKTLMFVLTLTKSIYMLFFKSLFLIMFMMNIYSLFSYNFPFLSLPSYSLSSGLTFWMVLSYINLTNNFNIFVSHWVADDTPTMLIPFVIIVEILSFLTRPLSLTIRLSANISAGHMLTYFCKMSGFLTTTLICMEIPISMIQAFVFILLLKSYFKESH